jgi:hypothetical protein
MITDEQLEEIEKAAHDAFFLADAGKAPDNSGYMSGSNQRYVRAVHPDVVMAMIVELRELRKLKANVRGLLK